MTANAEAYRLVALMHGIVVGLVRQDGVDLSVRQLAVLLICHLEDGPHHMGSLAVRLHVKRPAITRCVDQLVRLDLAVRATDLGDRRIVLVTRTPAGAAYVAALRALAQAAAGRIEAESGTPEVP